MGELSNLKPVIDIGIDPGGSSGCIAVIKTTPNSQVIEYHEFDKMTLKDLSEISSQFKIYVDAGFDISCTVEKVWAMPGMSAVAMGKFMQNFGHIEMMMACSAVPTVYLTPQQWQKFYSMKKEKTESKVQWKKRLRDKCERIYPLEKLKNSKVDALLLAHHNLKNK